MLLQFLAHHEGVVQLAHQLFFLVCQRIGVAGVHGGEVAGGQLVSLVIQVNGAPLVVYALEEAAVGHLPTGMALHDLPLYLELYHGDGLMHLRCQPGGFLVYVGGSTARGGLELLAGVIGISLHGEGGQWHEVDAIAVLQGGEVGVAQTHPDYVADACVVACGRAHPQDVVVAPLDVPTVVVTQRVHDDVRTGASVVDVAQDVQLVDGQPLYHLGYGHDEVVGPARGDDSVHDDVHVGRLVSVLRVLMEQFLDDIGEVGGQRFPHL